MTAVLCNGRTYSTSEMKAFTTPDPKVPKVYLTHDCQSVFVLTRDPSGGVEAHRAGTMEIISLSRRFELRELLDAFPGRPADAEVCSMPDDPTASEAVGAGGRIRRTPGPE